MYVNLSWSDSYETCPRKTFWTNRRKVNCAIRDFHILVTVDNKWFQRTAVGINTQPCTCASITRFGRCDRVLITAINWLRCIKWLLIRFYCLLSRHTGCLETTILLRSISHSFLFAESLSRVKSFIHANVNGYKKFIAFLYCVYLLYILFSITRNLRIINCLN